MQKSIHFSTKPASAKQQLYTLRRLSQRNPCTPVCCTSIKGLGVTVAGKVLLHDINLHLHCKTLTAIIGKNGAGKTTFIKALLGVLPAKGLVSFHKENSAAIRHPRFGYVPQELHIDKSSSVTVQDLVIAAISKYPAWLPASKKLKKLATKVLEISQAQELLSRPVSRLSGGELQRVLLALALVPLPDILLLGEPISGIDAQGVAMFYEIVDTLKHDNDITIIMVSHDLARVAKYADNVVLLDGTVTASGNASSVFATKAFRDSGLIAEPVL